MQKVQMRKANVLKRPGRSRKNAQAALSRCRSGKKLWQPSLSSPLPSTYRGRLSAGNYADRETICAFVLDTWKYVYIYIYVCEQKGNNLAAKTKAGTKAPSPKNKANQKNGKSVLGDGPKPELAWCGLISSWVLGSRPSTCEPHCIVPLTGSKVQWSCRATHSWL